MTENQRKVYDILKSNGGWMQSPDIALEGNFDRMADVTASLTSLMKYGCVDSIKQELFDGTILTFYCIIKEYKPVKRWFVNICNLNGFSICIKEFNSQAEALTFIKSNKERNDRLHHARYFLYKGEEVGEY